jgi:hypothetical protein
MTMTCSSLTARAQAALMDGSGQTFDGATVTEGLRQALALYNQAARTYDPAAGTFSSDLTVNGLDGAAVSNVPAEDETLLVQGAAALAAAFRWADRTEGYAAAVAAGANAVEGLRAFAEHQRRNFNEGLRAAARRSLWRTQIPPAAAWTWDESGNEEI